MLLRLPVPIPPRPMTPMVMRSEGAIRSVFDWARAPAGMMAVADVGALLGACLEDGLLFRDLLVDGLALGEEVGDGLLAVDVLAVAQGLEGAEGVPVVGGGDDDGIDVVAGAELAEVGVGVAAFVGGTGL